MPIWLIFMPTHTWSPLQHPCLAHRVLQLFPRLAGNEHMITDFSPSESSDIKKYFSILTAALEIPVLIFANGYVIIQ